MRWCVRGVRLDGMRVGMSFWEMKARQRCIRERSTSCLPAALPILSLTTPTTPTRAQAMASAAVKDSQPDGLAVPGDRIGRVSSHQAGPGKPMGCVRWREEGRLSMYGLCRGTDLPR